MKRIALFVMTNLAILVVLGIVTSLLGVNQYLSAQGLNLGMLLAFAAVIGFGGSIFSLLISKWMAKRATGAQVIGEPRNDTEAWMLQTVSHHAQAAGIGMPQVAIFPSDSQVVFLAGPQDAAIQTESS